MPAQSLEDQFLDTMIAGDAGIGLPIESPEPGTCSWIFTELCAWREGATNRPLWISGSSGCGKSVMSSLILREKNHWIPSKEENGGKMVVAGSFCDRNLNRQTPVWILRTLLYDIFSKNRNLIHTNDLDFWHESGIPEHPIPNLDAFESMESLAKLLGRVANQPSVSEVFLVVDGVYQQTQDAIGLYDLISQVSKHAGSNALPRWILSTRPNNFDRLMRNVRKIDLFEKNRGDMSIVARSRMKNFQRLNPTMSESFVNDVAEILTQRAEGLFLWLTLALKSLGAGTIWDIHSVKEKLQSIPYDVKAIYGGVFENIDRKMQKLLLWVHVAGRPLKISEVLVMWALLDGATSIEEIENKSPSPDTVCRFLESDLKALLALHSDGSIHFAHPSVKDFAQQLFSIPDKGDEPKRMSISKPHTQIAEACLAYLCLDEIRRLDVPEPPVREDGMIDTVKRERDVEQYLGGHCFLEYSIKFLGFHLGENEKNGGDNDGGKMDEFFGGKSQALQQWVRGYDFLVRCARDTGSANSLSLLFISARLNLTSLAEQFISTGSALASLVNIPGMKAIAEGASSLSLVRAQLIDLPDANGWRALHIAADSEAEKVVAWLLRNGAAVDSETIEFLRPGRTALHFAASKTSHTAVRIVRELLDKGANPGLPTMFGGNTPLHCAVQGGSVDMITTLLHHNTRHDPVDPNVPNYYGMTALHKAASIPGWEAVVEVLLANGGDPEQVSSLDKVAVFRGVKDATVVSTLKAMASAKPGAIWESAANTFRGVATNQTALHMAVRAKGTEETVRRLLNWYAERRKTVDSRDSMGYTPLHAAAEGDSCRTHIKLLVDSGLVDVNAQGSDGRTPLILYVRRLGQQQSRDLGDLVSLKQTMDDLLHSGAAADTKDKDGMSAIDYAKQAGPTWAAEKLLNAAVLPHPASLSSGLDSASQPQAESLWGVMGRTKMLLKSFSWW
ncbi:hypothetical protein Trco_003222 [Trichoderma cornu-damae]|uniref:Nephrocystin 3-like N-terminal domain-containing protein n=1 Tax=Trichoderma cornu-damae TaxID=654480 RepID=A0A9P8TVT5_9HYPO|nr:hypothetical protein Trco_003222 [Trichoderma cornu-damae]